MDTEKTIVRLQIGMLIGSLVTIGLFYLWTTWQPEQKAESQAIPDADYYIDRNKTKRAVVNG